MITILFRRLWRQRGLTLALAAGMLAVIALSAAIPIFADAAQYRVLQTQLQENSQGRPPFAFLFRYIGAWHGPISWARYASADAYLTQEASAQIGLPQQMLVRYARTENLQLFPADTDAYQDSDALFWTNLAFATDLATHIELSEGQFPAQAADGAIPVLISQALADESGIQVGESFLLRHPDGAHLPVRIAGVWRPKDATDPYWFYAPDAFRETLFTSEDLFRTQVAPRFDAPVQQAVWYWIMDGREVRSARVGGLLKRIARVQSQADALLPNVSLDVSPVEALEAYRATVRALMLQMTLFGLPIFGILLTFLTLVGAMLGERRHNESAILRSRGASIWQLTAMQAGESALIGIVVLPGGLWLAGFLARRLGAVRTFLDPALVFPSSLPPVRFTATVWLFSWIALLMALLAATAPSLRTARHTIVSYKQELARQLRPPLWQRFYLDFLLLLPALYGYYVLRQQGAAALTQIDPFQNPLIFLVPTLFILALTLLTVRFMPWLWRALAAGLARLPGVSLLLAIRHLDRSPAMSAAPLLLLILTLGLATFIASMALTFDRHLHDDVYYRVGADLRLVELGESTAQHATTTGPSSAAASDDQPRWLFLPISEHLRIPGVRAAARVGQFDLQATFSDATETGRILGIDRVDFQQVAFFRPDFAADASLGALMNRLAQNPNAALVQRRFLERHNLRLGDPLSLTISKEGERTRITLVVAGTFDLFPTFFPEDGPLVVTHLDTLFQALGGEVPYDVWLRLAPGVNGAEVTAQVRKLGIQVVTAQDARALIRQAQEQPMRQGVFGILSAGFLAAALLTTLGFVIFAFLSFQRRFIELGVLRALGLSRGQMALLLAAEQALLLSVGVSVGVGLGVLAARLFIPFLQTGSAIPPFVVRVAWREIGFIVLLFTLTLFFSVILLWIGLRRLRLFEAVKLGESI